MFSEAETVARGLDGIVTGGALEFRTLRQGRTKVDVVRRTLVARVMRRCGVWSWPEIASAMGLGSHSTAWVAGHRRADDADLRLAELTLCCEALHLGIVTKEARGRLERFVRGDGFTAEARRTRSEEPAPCPLPGGEGGRERHTAERRQAGWKPAPLGDRELMPDAGDLMPSDGGGA